MNVDEEEPHDDEDILNNNELQLPGESRNSCVMRADAQILSSSLPSSSDLVPGTSGLRPLDGTTLLLLPLHTVCLFPLFCFMSAIATRLAYNF